MQGKDSKYFLLTKAVFFVTFPIVMNAIRLGYTIMFHEFIINTYVRQLLC